MEKLSTAAEKNLKAKKKGWEEAAKRNAMYYISTKPDLDRNEFFTSGIEQVERFTAIFFTSMNFDPTEKRMLDIGCGTGRMTRAFSTIFAEAYGGDISDEMIKQAKSLNQDISNVFFDVNNGANLGIYESDFFDFVFSYAQRLSENV